MKRHDGREPAEVRKITIRRGFTRQSPGSVLIQAGGTMILCTAHVSSDVPAWLAGRGKGWITAEYNMLPGSTSPRKARDRGARTDGRTTEIQRLIGGSFRAVADLEALGERLVTIDCDVLQADGGTRTMSVTGGLIALVDAPRAGGPWARYPLSDSVAAVSVGVVDGHIVTDLDYHEDSRATVDMNVVMTSGGRFVELQGTGEQATFDERQLQGMLAHARTALKHIDTIQRDKLGRHWPWPA